MANIVHRIGMKAPLQNVFAAVARKEGVQSWWTNEVRGSDKLQESLEFIFRTPEGDVKGKMAMKITALKTDS